MIATITRVWVGTRFTTIIVRDLEDGLEKRCFLVNRTHMSQFYAALCDRASANGHPEQKRQVVLTVKPRTAFGYEIELAEVLPPSAQQVDAEARIAARVKAMPL